MAAKRQRSDRSDDYDYEVQSEPSNEDDAGVFVQLKEADIHVVCQLQASPVRAGRTAEESLSNLKSWLDEVVISRCCAVRVSMTLTDGQDAVGVFQRLNLVELNAV